MPGPCREHGAFFFLLPPFLGPNVLMIMCLPKRPGRHTLITVNVPLLWFLWRAGDFHSSGVGAFFPLLWTLVHWWVWMWSTEEPQGFRLTPCTRSYRKSEKIIQRTSSAIVQPSTLHSAIWHDLLQGRLTARHKSNASLLFSFGVWSCIRYVGGFKLANLIGAKHHAAFLHKQIRVDSKLEYHIFWEAK